MRTKKTNTVTKQLKKKTPKKTAAKITKKKTKKPKKTTKREINNMIATLQCPLPRDTLTFNNELGRKENEIIIKKQAARLRALKARIIKKQSNAQMVLKQARQAPAKDALAMAIDMANILDCDEPASQQNEGMELFEDNEVAQLCKSPDMQRAGVSHKGNEGGTLGENSSSSSGSSSTDSSDSSSSEDEHFREKTLVRNPFASLQPSTYNEDT